MKPNLLFTLLIFLSSSFFIIIAENQHDHFSEIILNGIINKEPSLCGGNHINLSIKYNDHLYIICHSHGEAHNTGDLIASISDENGKIISAKAALLTHKHEKLLLSKLNGSELIGKKYYIESIQKHSKKNKEE